MTKKSLTTPLGVQIETEHFLALFGNKNSNIDSIRTTYPQYDFVRVKQTHSNIAKETNNTTDDLQFTADAHWTLQRGLALCVSTADCVPVLFYCPDKNICSAIHAGWRGVANQIIKNTFLELKKLGANPENLLVLIGPHILMPSFEVANDVKDLLLSSTSLEKIEGTHWKNTSLGRCLISLIEILNLQLCELKIPKKNLFFHLQDTKTDPEYHSHRRDRDLAGRQLSFIVLK